MWSEARVCPFFLFLGSTGRVLTHGFMLEFCDVIKAYYALCHTSYSTVVHPDLLYVFVELTEFEISDEIPDNLLFV